MLQAMKEEISYFNFRDHYSTSYLRNNPDIDQRNIHKMHPQTGYARYDYDNEETGYLPKSSLKTSFAHGFHLILMEPGSANYILHTTPYNILCCIIHCIILYIILYIIYYYYILHYNIYYIILYITFYITILQYLIFIY